MYVFMYVCMYVCACVFRNVKCTVLCQMYTYMAFPQLRSQWAEQRLARSHLTRRIYKTVTTRTSTDGKRALLSAVPERI